MSGGIRLFFLVQSGKLLACPLALLGDVEYLVFVDLAGAFDAQPFLVRLAGQPEEFLVTELVRLDALEELFRPLLVRSEVAVRAFKLADGYTVIGLQLRLFIFDV